MKYLDRLPPHLQFDPDGLFANPIEYPRDARPEAPTPLDPYLVHHGDGTSYIENTVEAIGAKVESAGRVIGLDEDHRKSVAKELTTDLAVRVVRNEESFDRLRDSIKDRELDRMMIEIIEKARAGAADPQELLRLITEHPDMISVEFFKRTTPFDPSEHSDAEHLLTQILDTLQQSFYDAEIIYFDAPVITTKPFYTENGALVWKQKIGEAKSQYSHTEIIVKYSKIVPSSKRHPQGLPINLVAPSGSRVNMLPLAISAYFRVADYKNRPGYNSPEGEFREYVGSDTIDALLPQVDTMDKIDHLIEIESVLDAIPPNMREVYANLLEQHFR